MTGRELPQALSDEIEKAALKPFIAIHINTPDPVFAWTGKGTLEFDGAQWTGIEGIASINSVGESTDGSATGFSATLLRVPEEFRDDLADQAVRGVLYTVYVGALDENYQIVTGYQLIFKGTLQSYEIVDAGDSLTVTAGGESRAIDQKRPTIKRFTDEYQQRKYDGDRFFEYVPRMAELPILWAKGSQDGL